MTLENKKSNKKSIWTLIAGIAFLGIGSYRVYNHFYETEPNSGSFRLIMAAIFIGYGIYSLYTYFKTK